MGKRRCLAGWVQMHLMLIIAPGVLQALNINQKNVTVYSGPEGSYFGFSVDFFQTTGQGVSLIVGAPLDNSSQTNVEEGGSVYRCPWPANTGTCQKVEFDPKGDEVYTVADLTLKGSKSHQWFGASVRATDKYIMACAPLFHWNVLNSFNESQNTPVGNCFLKDVTTGLVSTYSPCRETYVEFHYMSTRYVNDKRYCQAGFSADITQNGTVVIGAPGSLYFQGQIFTATLKELTAARRRTSTYTYLPSRGVGQEIHYAFDEKYSDTYSGYSVATGFLTGNNIQDYVVGFPTDSDTSGSVRIYNGRLDLKKKFFGTQVAAYFGHAVAVTDINSDGRDDILIGAPLFIEQLANQQQREVGQVYVYLQQARSRFNGRPDQTLTGSMSYGRFGASIAPLGDLDNDGYNDVAVGSPSSDENGRVFIYMGQSEGLSPQPAQVLESPFPSPRVPSAFGFTLKGGTDVDDNGYPDLIVGAWGVSKIAVYKTLAVVKAKAQLAVFPDVLNPEEKTCSLTRTNKAVSCFTVMICISVSGHRIPQTLALSVKLQLDKMKQALTHRTLLLHNSQPQERVTRIVQTNQTNTCFNTTAYLRSESEFKDKLSPIFISVNYTLVDMEETTLQGQTSAMAQTRIMLDCGSDNICIPDLKLKAYAEKSWLVIGDDNPVGLVVEAENRGEGAYETELHITPPKNIHFQEPIRGRDGFSMLSCFEKKDQGSVIVVCEVGNPMPAGQKLKAGLLFSVGNLEEVESDVTFFMQIKSKNSHSSVSDPVSLKINVTASATLQIAGSTPMDVVLPILDWKPVEHPATLDQVGPYVEHVYMLGSLGPSTANVKVVVNFPTHHLNSTLLYIYAIDYENFLNCSFNESTVDPDGLAPATTEAPVNRTSQEGHHINKREVLTDAPQDLDQPRETIHVTCSSQFPCVRVECDAIGMKFQGNAVIRVIARLWVNTFLKRPNVNYILQSNAYYQVTGTTSKIQLREYSGGRAQTFTNVIWKEDTKVVPVWLNIVAVASGLLLLALLSFILWKVGFFKRNRPPSDDEDDNTENLCSE